MRSRGWAGKMMWGSEGGFARAPGMFAASPPKVRTDSFSRNARRVGESICSFAPEKELVCRAAYHFVSDTKRSRDLLEPSFRAPGRTGAKTIRHRASLTQGAKVNSLSLDAAIAGIVAD